MFLRLDAEARYDELLAEFTLTAQWIRRVPNNESPYNYVVGLAALLQGPPLARYLKGVPPPGALSKSMWCVPVGFHPPYHEVIKIGLPLYVFVPKVICNRFQ